ncbi:DMT family transporter [Hyphomicrobium sp.]|uniref:DMT family transporter n=1 Tax=Hyphomicrobium sp. TaxID=82 RepID=UPI0025BB8267|nr:DMT family transporter [Hyphomicrobium sp.]MCC7252697.1 DMT family transporter [Hyphomicrobium sp.]
MNRVPDLPSAAEIARRRLQAIGLMLMAVVLFSGLDTTAKYLVTREGLGMGQVVWSRFIGQFALLFLLVPAFGVMSTKALFTTSRLGWQLVRSVLMVGTTAFNFLALEYLRLDQTITIVFLAPLVVALLAGPLLGEWVGRRRVAAVMVGFVGVLIAVRPGFGVMHPAVLYAFAAMLAYAFFMLLTRHMARFDPPLVTLFYSMFVGAIGGIPFAIADWQTPSHALAWVLLGALGILGGLGHWLFLHAYRLAPASAIAPFLYMQLLTMVAFGFAVFGDLPDLWTLAGATLIVASGVYLVHRERQLAREVANATALS